MIKTKYTIIHKKHDRYEGVFRYDRQKIKIIIRKSYDYLDGYEYLEAELYKFYKGRYVFVRRTLNLDIGLVEISDYIVDKCIERQLITKENDYYKIILGSFSENVNNNGRIYPPNIIEDHAKNLMKKVKRGELSMPSKAALDNYNEYYFSYGEIK